MERFNNLVSKRNIDVYTLPVIVHEGEEFRKYENTYKTKLPTGCQCFNDCDCHLTYGKIVEVNEVFYRHIKFDNTDKAFYSVPYIPRDYKLNPY